MKKFLLSFGLTVVSGTLLVGCGSGSNNSNKSVTELVEFFGTNGFQGQRGEKLFALVGAADGCSLKGSDFTIDIYKFSDPAKVHESMDFKNGNFGIDVRNGEKEKINKVFQDFK